MFLLFDTKTFSTLWWSTCFFYFVVACFTPVCSITRTKIPHFFLKGPSQRWTTQNEQVHHRHNLFSFLPLFLLDMRYPVSIIFFRGQKKGVIWSISSFVPKNSYYNHYSSILWKLVPKFLSKSLDQDQLKPVKQKKLFVVHYGLNATKTTKNLQHNFDTILLYLQLF